VLLAPRVDLPALVDVADKHFVVDRVVGERRGAVVLEPLLDVDAVVRVAVGGDDGVVHENAVERHVLQLLWGVGEGDDGGVGGAHCLRLSKAREGASQR
jgi:hypothetical protein